MKVEYSKALLSITHRFAAAAKRHPYLLVLLVVAFSFRFSGIFWGIPPFDAGTYHPDEPKIIVGAHRFPQDILLRQDLRYPTACHYTLGALTWPIKKLLEPSGYDWLFVYMTGRLLSVTLGTATVLLVFLLARRYYGRPHAIVAASALAFSMFHVTNSAWATTDVTTSFLLSLFLLLLVSTIERQSLWLSVFTGVTLGMLVGSKYTGAFAVIPLFVLVFTHETTQQQSRPLMARVIRFSTNKIIWIVGCSSLLIFILSTPGILLHPEAFLSSIESERTRMAQSKLPIYELSVWSNNFAILVRTMGLPLALFSCLGLCISCFSRKRFEIALASLVIVYLLYFGSALAPRYVIMIMPILAIFAARALMFFFSAKSTWVRMGSLAVCLGVLLHAFWYSASAIVSRYPDNRTIVTQYISEQIPSGSTIGIAYTSEKYDYPRHLWRYPRIDLSVLRYVDFLESPEFIVVSSNDANKIVATLQSDLLGEDFTFPASLAHQWYRKSPPSPEIFAFFHSLYFSDQTKYELLKKFTPRHMLAPIEFPPPTIEIFRRTHNEPWKAEL